MPTHKNPATPPSHSKDLGILLYRVVPHNGGLVFAPKGLALYVAAVHGALKRARTWSEFRSMLPRSEYSEVIRASFDEMGERRPKGTDPFDAEQVAGWSDGDYPQWLQQDMTDYLPEEVLREYGTLEHTFVNGSFWMIPPENASRMIRSLEKCGFRVENGEKVMFY